LAADSLPDSERELAGLSGVAVRALIRAGALRRPTSGIASGWVQANLVVLPEREADDFRRFCELNPRPCPLLDVTVPGSPEPVKAAKGADLRSDIGRYRIYRKGVLAGEAGDLRRFWRRDSVGFLLGCSFTFEAALQRAGVPLRHIELGRNVSMYKTSLQCAPAGRFHGPLVVSMRPVSASLVDRVSEITAQFPGAHGAPLHAGDPAVLGIDDLQRPDYGDPVPVLPDEVPVFWACGVTPQAVAMEAKPPLLLTHSPGHMFLTDLRDSDLEGA
jgi:uncharacterized protein YcsI (UPF0317 family)